MKNSIKLKITLWFTFFMVILVSFILLFLILAGKQLTRADTQYQLKEIVENLVEQKGKSVENHLDKVENTLDFVTFENGVYLLVYDGEDELVSGEYPTSLSSQTDLLPEFSQGEVQVFETDDGTWYVYDEVLYTGHDSIYWLRGIISADESFYGLNKILKLYLYLLPVLTGLAALGGYMMLQHTLEPVRKITETAKKIGESQDLKKRIQLGKGNDEIHTLANAFDEMFDKLEYAFVREKQFTADASHELRTPTAVIRSLSEYALESNDPGEYREALIKILGHSEKMGNLINQLLTLARTDQGKETLLMETVNLSELAELVCESSQEEAEKKDIKIHLDKGQDLFYKGDETMLMRMLINLMQNGIHYGKEHGNLWIDLKRKASGVSIVVRDDGIGIEDKNLSKIWERFFREDTSRNRENQNAGLGLSMVKWIVMAHGGTITVRSKKEEGSIFTIELP